MNRNVLGAAQSLKNCKRVESKTAEEDGTPLGVKKIYDMGVFSITCTFAVFAYIWVYYVLIDYTVEPHEAYITLALMPLLLILATACDKFN